MLTAETVIDYLQSLGDTPDAIAKRLKEDGITGIRCSEHNCALANALKSRFHDNVIVLNYQIVVGSKILLNPGWFGCTLEGTICPAMAPFDFAWKFDCGMYPELFCKADEE